jgi:hypothetical protein
MVELELDELLQVVGGVEVEQLAVIVKVRVYQMVAMVVKV